MLHCIVTKDDEHETRSTELHTLSPYLIKSNSNNEHYFAPNFVFNRNTKRRKLF